MSRHSCSGRALRGERHPVGSRLRHSGSRTPRAMGLSAESGVRPPRTSGRYCEETACSSRSFRRHRVGAEDHRYGSRRARRTRGMNGARRRAPLARTAIVRAGRVRSFEQGKEPVALIGMSARLDPRRQPQLPVTLAGLLTSRRVTRRVTPTGRAFSIHVRINGIGAAFVPGHSGGGRSGIAPDSLFFRPHRAAGHQRPPALIPNPGRVVKFPTAPARWSVYNLRTWRETTRKSVRT